MPFNRRKFISQSFVSAAGMAATAMIPDHMFGNNLHRTTRPEEIILPVNKSNSIKETIKFSVIGLNHGHIYGMVDSLISGGGIMVAVFAKEPEFLKDFTQRYPNVKVVKSEKEIIEDSSIQLVASASIPTILVIGSLPVKGA